MKTLTAFCDLKYCPISYDFSTFLVRAMLERDRSGCDALHVVLVPNEGGLGGFSRHWGEHDEAATRWRMWHIVMPLCALAGATVCLLRTRAEADAPITNQFWRPTERVHLAGHLIDSARAGEAIPKLRATDAARRYVKEWHRSFSHPLITLTTRNQTTDPARNSRLQDWWEMGEHLERAGFNVVSLQDSNEAFKSPRGNWGEICVDMRAALYESAFMNLVGNNGPCGLLQYLNAPYICFGFGLPKDSWAQYVRDHLHMQYGEQLPWANVNQRLVWSIDSFDNMKAEFQKWENQNRPRG